MTVKNRQLNEQARQETLKVMNTVISDSIAVIEAFNKGELNQETARQRINAITNTVNNFEDDMTLFGGQLFEQMADYFLTAQAVDLQLSYEADVHKNRIMLDKALNPSTTFNSSLATSPVSFPTPLATKGNDKEKAFISEFEKRRVEFSKLRETYEAKYYEIAIKRAEKQKLLDTLQQSDLGRLEGQDIAAMTKILEKLQQEIADSQDEVTAVKNQLAEMSGQFMKKESKEEGGE